MDKKIGTTKSSRGNPTTLISQRFRFTYNYNKYNIKIKKKIDIDIFNRRTVPEFPNSRNSGEYSLKAIFPYERL